MVFRVVGDTPPGAEDFKSYEEQDLPGGTPCRRVGLSVFRDFEDAIRCCELLPMLGDRVASAALDASHGKLKHTPSTRTGPSHHTWWAALGLTRHSLFTVVET